MFIFIYSIMMNCFIWQHVKSFWNSEDPCPTFKLQLQIICNFKTVYNEWGGASAVVMEIVQCNKIHLTF
jgi:hypothetical protein